MKRLIIATLFCTVVLPSCDSGKESPAKDEKQETANAGLADAIEECEEHLAKLDHLNETLREARTENPEDAVGVYVATLDDWFKERLITRAKLNARGGMLDAADRLDVTTVDSLATFYSDAKMILVKDPAALTHVESALQKYGYYRLVVQKLGTQ
jgi:hypothetical protein